MREERLLTNAMLYMMERQRVLTNFATKEDETYLENIKDAMEKRAGHEHKMAIINYLNAIIGGERRHYKLIKTACGKELFQKLIAAGLKKIS
jgi:hypothetical protein